MNSCRVRIVLGVVLMLLLEPASSFGSPLYQTAEFREISGAPLRIEVGSNGSIQVYHERTGNVGAAYGTADSGFFLAIGDDVYGPDLANTNGNSAFGSSTNTLGLISHEGPTGSGSASDPFEIATVQTLDGSGASLEVVQTVSYINGNDYFRQDWNITNNGDSEVCFKAYHAADIFFAGSDSGAGYYSTATGSVGGQGTDNDDNPWFMVFSPVTPADHYQEGGYREIWNAVSEANDLNDSIVEEVVDNGIALQWNQCVQPGETTTISDLWSFGENEETVVEPIEEVAPTPTPGCDSCGDVHILTPDGLKYDFQAKGEFLATQSSDGGVIVQARQSPWVVDGEVRNERVSVNTAVAFQVGLDGDKIEFYVKPELGFYVNDVAEALPSSRLALTNGGSIDPIGSESRPEFIITWPNGSFKARVIMYPNSHIDYGVRGSGTLEGLLGDLDGDAQNDLQVNDGDMSTENEVITPLPSADELTRFGDSWRVSAEESLFSIAAEVSTDQTDGAEPLTMQDIDAEEREEAANTCGEAGVSNELALRDCTYDVAATGDEIFVESAKTIEETVENLGPENVVPAQPGETLGGNIFDANQADEAGISILDDDELIVTTGMSADGSGYIRFHIYRDGEYVTSYSVGTDANVADALAEAMAVTDTSPEEASEENAVFDALPDEVALRGGVVSTNDRVSDLEEGTIEAGNTFRFLESFWNRDYPDYNVFEGDTTMMVLIEDSPVTKQVAILVPNLSETELGQAANNAMRDKTLIVTAAGEGNQPIRPDDLAEVVLTDPTSSEPPYTVNFYRGEDEARELVATFTINVE